MEHQEPKVRKFFVLQGGPAADIEGPATRLGLYDRFPAPDKVTVGVMVLTKVALLAAMLYFIRA